MLTKFYLENMKGVYWDATFRWDDNIDTDLADME